MMSHRDYCCGPNEDDDLDDVPPKGYSGPFSMEGGSSSKRYHSSGGGPPPRHNYVGMSSLSSTSYNHHQPALKTVYDGVFEEKADECRDLIQRLKTEGKWQGADRDDHFSYNVYSMNPMGQVLENVFDAKSGTFSKHRIVGDPYGPAYHGWIHNNGFPHSFS
jgi:hypothetical protein